MDAVKALLREIFVALNVYIGKEESSQINNLNFHLEKLLKRRAKSTHTAEGWKNKGKHKKQ